MIRGIVVVLLLVAIAAFALSNPGTTRIAEHADDGGLRIVTMAPAFTEILLYLGVGDGGGGQPHRIVGVSVWDEELPEVARIGDLAKPDLERIFALEPDLVLGLESATQAPFFQLLEERGLAVEVRRVETVEDIQRTVNQLGARFGRGDRAAQFSQRLERQLAAAPPVDAQRSRVLFVVQHEPTLWVAGNDTFVHTMLGAAGGANVFEDQNGYFQVTVEEVVKRQPDLIVDASIEGADSTVARTRWQGYSRHLHAVSGKRVHAFPAVRPSVRVCDWIDQLRDLVRDTNGKR